MQFTIGMFNGTSMIQNDEEMTICAEAITIDIIEGAITLHNETTSGSVF